MHSRECASWHSGRGWRWREDATPRTWLPRSTRQGAFLERHGGIGALPGAIVDQDARCSASTPARTCSRRTASRLGDRGTIRCTSGHRRGREHRHRRSRNELLADEVAVREVTLHRGGGCVDGVRVRSHGAGSAVVLRKTSALGATRASGRAQGAPSARRRASWRACTQVIWSSATDGRNLAPTRGLTSSRDDFG